MKIYRLLSAGVCVLFLIGLDGCSREDYADLKAGLVMKYSNRRPKEWAEAVSGVKTRLDTQDNVIALTLDACGSDNDGYDVLLIDYLVSNNIKATLFINARWIDKNPVIFSDLAKNPLFEIANHGLRHKPCSVTGRSAYGISGTKDCAEAVDEIRLNAKKIQELTGHYPGFYRSGTAYYDEVGVEIANALGEEAVGFSVLGDKGATYSKDEVKKAFLSATPGAIIICHMNHPEKETAEGVIEAMPVLKKRGFRFVKLSEYALK